MKNTIYLLLLLLITSFLSVKAEDDKTFLGLRREVFYGNASWYGGLKFNGRRTASGEIYNPRKMTAAHRNLPFNTKVRVTNTKNDKSVVVKINDRGPFSHDRIIDLSEKAASKLDLKRAGIGSVKVQVLRLGEVGDYRPSGRFRKFARKLIGRN